MKIPRPLLSILLLPSLLAAGAPALRAQSEALVLQPPFGQIFPLADAGGVVRVQVPVLINESVILQPADALRFVYIDPNAGHGAHGGGGGNDTLWKSHVGSQGTIYNDPETGAMTHGEQGAGGWGDNNTDDTAGIFDENARKGDAKRDKKELQSEVWRQKDLFDQALDNAADVGTTIVYSLPAQRRPLTATVDLPEGMLLAEIGGHVRVLGLIQEGRAYQGGIRPGDEIRSIANGAPLASLGDFVRAYIAIKHQARVTGNPAYSVQVWRPSEGQLVTVQMAAPPTIPSFF